MTSGLALVALLAVAVQEPAQPIEDNSFLLEEAYNQESGVVQHISTLLRAGQTWSYTFTQEWPLGSQHHQLSYTVPIDRGVGNIGINYRWQAVSPAAGVAIAPRLSVLAPMRRDAATAVQVNLPLSVSVARPFVAHINIGATATGRSKTSYNAGTSLIWLARPTINALLEVVWIGDASNGDLVINPGLRWAHDLGRLQIVPGVSFPDGRDVLLYLSFEHPFKS